MYAFTRSFSFGCGLAVALLLGGCAKQKALNQPPKTPVFFDNKNCPDLVIDYMEVTKLSKSAATILFVLRNVGDTAATLGGSSPKPYDNVALKFYFSPDDKLDRGDIQAGGYFVDNKQLKAMGGVLKAGDKYTDEFTIELDKRTSYTPIVVVNLDALQTVSECDETNNISSIVF